MASLSGKIDALGRNLVEYRAETRVDIAGMKVEIAKLERKIDIAAVEINAKIEKVEGNLHDEITESKGSLGAQIDALKMNGLTHVAQGISEIAFLLVQHGVLSRDEAEHVRDVVTGK